MKKQILVLDELKITKKVLKKKITKYHLVFKKFKNQNELEDYSKNKNFHAIYCSFGYELNKKILSNLNNIKYIISPTTGIDHIDKYYCFSKNIKIISLKGETNFLKNVTSTAEMTWALILALARNLKDYQKDITVKKNWNRDLCFGTQLNGSSIGIIGYGRVGKIVVNYAKAFGMRILVNERKKLRALENKSFKFTSLKKVLKCKFVSIHIPLDGNHNFFNKKLIPYISKDTIIINTSRGEIFDPKTLAYLLKKNYIFGLDVLPGDVKWKSKIPKKFHFISKLKKTIITPHISGNTNEARFKTTNFIIDKFLKIKK